MAHLDHKCLHWLGVAVRKTSVLPGGAADWSWELLHRKQMVYHWATALPQLNTCLGWWVCQLPVLPRNTAEPGRLPSLLILLGSLLSHSWCSSFPLPTYPLVPLASLLPPMPFPWFKAVSDPRAMSMWKPHCCDTCTSLDGLLMLSFGWVNSITILVKGKRFMRSEDKLEYASPYWWMGKGCPIPNQFIYIKMKWNETYVSQHFNQRVTRHFVLPVRYLLLTFASGYEHKTWMCQNIFSLQLSIYIVFGVYITFL